MKTITFECETITPMFLSGADGTTPELRPPSIKAAMRFWWRAMNINLVNSINGNWDYNLLKEEEAKLYGGSSGNGNRSAVSITITDLVEKVFTINDLKKSAQERFEIQRNGKRKKAFGLEGIAYIFYVYLTSNDHSDKKGYAIGTTFKLTLSSNDNNDLLKACANLWLLSYLGGLGARARRGAGAFKIKIANQSQISDEFKKLVNESGLQFEIAENQKLIDFYKENYRVTQKIFKINNSITNCNEYSNLENAKVYISRSDFASWELAINDIGKMLKAHRTSIRPFPNAEFTQKTLNKKAAFGLPIKVRNIDSPFVELKKYDRRASPLYITALNNAGKYYWIVTHLSGDFMEQDDSITFDVGKIEEWSNVDNSLLLSFINKISNLSNKVV